MEKSDLAKARSTYEQEHPSYSTFTSKIEKLIIELLDLDSIKYHFVESRTKSLSSFAEKVQRPGKLYKDPMGELPDISGIRAIVYYTDDIPNVEAIIKREFEVQEEDASHLPNQYDPDRFGYLSAHYVCSLKDIRTSLPEWSAYKDKHFEIQIRTVLQHGWAAISHALQYKRVSDVPAELQRRLNRLASLFEIADDEFIALRDSQSQIEESAIESFKKGDASIEINAFTVPQFILGWGELENISRAIRQFGYVFVDDDFKYQLDEGESDSIEAISSLVQNIKRVGIETIGDLETALNFDPIPFLKSAIDAEEKEWIISEEFLVLLILIRAKIGEFTVKDLIDSGWDKSISERVLNAAKQDML